MDSEKQILANDIKIFGTVFLLASIMSIFFPFLFIISPIYYLVVDPKENWNYDVSDEEIKKIAEMYYDHGLMFTLIALIFTVITAPIWVFRFTGLSFDSNILILFFTVLLIL